MYHFIRINESGQPYLSYDDIRTTGNTGFTPCKTAYIQEEHMITREQHNNQIRQGDIILIRVADAPHGYEHRPAKRAIVGYGEVTGHHHALTNVEWVVAPETTPADLEAFAQGTKTLPVFVVATDETELIHDEHDLHKIAPGVWRVLRQKEWITAPIAVRD